MIEWATSGGKGERLPQEQTLNALYPELAAQIDALCHNPDTRHELAAAIGLYQWDDEINKGGALAPPAKRTLNRLLEHAEKDYPNSQGTTESLKSAFRILLEKNVLNPEKALAIVNGEGTRFSLLAQINELVTDPKAVMDDDVRAQLSNMLSEIRALSGPARGKKLNEVVKLMKDDSLNAVPEVNIDDLCRDPVARMMLYKIVNERWWLAQEHEGKALSRPRKRRFFRWLDRVPLENDSDATKHLKYAIRILVKDGVLSQVQVLSMLSEAIGKTYQRVMK